MTKKKRLLLTIVLALIITFFCNYQYFFAGTQNQVGSYTSHNTSDVKTFFTFKNFYLYKDYNAVILWDKLLVSLIVCYLIAKGLRDDFSENFSLKISAKAKKEDKVFVLLFLILLILPMARFDNRSSDSYENRTLGSKPKLFITTDDQYHLLADAIKENKEIIHKLVNPKSDKDSQTSNTQTPENPQDKPQKILRLNTDYLNDFEDYINDRFFLRAVYIDIFKNFIYNLAIVAPHHDNRVIDKKNKWLYRYYIPPSYQKYLNTEEYNTLVNEIRQSLSAFREYCKRKNIDLYIMVYPEKESIYHPSFVKKYNDNDVIDFVKDVDKKDFSFYYKNRLPSANDVIQMINKVGKKNYADNKVGIIYSPRRLPQEINPKLLNHCVPEYHLTNNGMFIEYKKSSVYHPEIKLNNNMAIINQIKNIPVNSEFNIIFPFYDIQEKAKNSTKGLLYYKTEHHLTDRGTYIGYLKLLSQMKKSKRRGFTVDINKYQHGKNNYVRSENRLKYSYGMTCSQVGLTEKQCEDFLDYDYDYYSYNGSSAVISKRIREPYLLMEHTHYGKAPNRKLLLVGNSNIEGLMNFIQYSFKDVYKLRLNGPSKIPREEQYKVLKYYKPVIDEIKPDIIVICVGYDVFINLKNLISF